MRRICEMPAGRNSETCLPITLLKFAMQVHVFARAPVPGQCKTRLIPHLGARGAAWVQRRLVEHALTVAIEAVGRAQVTLWCAPDTAHHYFHRCQQQFGVRLARQVHGDLGRRMRHALRQQPGLLIGADAYGLNADDIRRAALALGGVDYLLLPATDGGYVLIGARRLLPTLTGVAWSTGRECRQTARRLKAAGTLAYSSPARADFDTAADWRKARRSGRLAALAGR